MEKQYKTLYICYFGLRESLVQTQVLPYLRELSKLENLEVNLLTFEPELKKKWTPEQIEKEKRLLAEKGIKWNSLAYHKSPSAPATFFDVLNGTRFVVSFIKQEEIDFLHARNHIPMLIAMLVRKIVKGKTIFDIRGLMAEEYADSGVWKENSKPFRFIKFIERKGIEKASQIVVLTNQMRDYLLEKKLKSSEMIQVIPCCVDFSRVEKSNNENQKSDYFQLIYAGSTTGLYLLEEMGRFFLELKNHKPDAFFQVLTASPPEFVSETFEKLGIRKENFTVIKVSADEVPKYLKQAHLGISFRSPTFSQIASSPTKIPEYLACGLPVVSNYGIGDTDSLLENEKVGVSLKSFDEIEMENQAIKILDILNENKLAEKCVKIAHKYFDLNDVGGKNYQNVYRRLMK